MMDEGPEAGRRSKTQILRLVGGRPLLTVGWQCVLRVIEIHSCLSVTM
jgi:hypothetical protein